MGENATWPRSALVCIAPGCRYIENALAGSFSFPRSCPAHGTPLSAVLVMPAVFAEDGEQNDG